VIPKCPNLRIEVALKKGKAIDLGLDWDGKRKCPRKHPPKRRVMKGLHTLESSKASNQSVTLAVEGPSHSSISTTMTVGTTNPTEHSRPRDQSSLASSTHAATSPYGMSYMIPGYSMSPGSVITSHAGFEQYASHSNHNHPP